MIIYTENKQTKFLEQLSELFLINKNILNCSDFELALESFKNHEIFKSCASPAA